MHELVFQHHFQHRHGLRDQTHSSLGKHILLEILKCKCWISETGKTNTSIQFIEILQLA